MPPKITRIDMYLLPDHTVRVFKYPEGWNIDSRPLENYVSTVPLDQMTTWLQDHGWTVRTWTEGDWAAGARAWLGELAPIRRRTEIMRRRSNYARPYNYTTNGLDFAYDT